MNELFLDLSFSKVDLDANKITEIENKIRAIETPKFANYLPDLETINLLKEKYQHKKNFIIEGNGGSISTFRAFYECLGRDLDKNVFLLDTDDPDFVTWVKNQCAPEDTLLIVISKSGNSIQAITSYMALDKYEAIFITMESGALYEIGKKRNIAVVKHPDISGRFSGITESSLTPAGILGIDIEEIVRGAKLMNESCSPKTALEANPALQLAAHLDSLEKVGYNEVFLSIYSKQLMGFFELIIQLFHESVCKDGKGQTFYGGEAPENQHHTLQRFNSGSKNSVGFFIKLKDFENKPVLKVGEDIKAITVKDIKLEQFDNLTLKDIIDTEFKGTWQDTIENEIPSIRLEIEKISPFHLGMLTAFMQYCAFYSALLRGVNPCTQPGVEKSKEYMFKIIEKDF